MNLPHFPLHFIFIYLIFPSILYSFHSFIHSFRPFLYRPFKSSTTQRRSRLQHGYCIGVSRRSAQATVGKGLAQGPYMPARAGVEPTTLRLKAIDSTKAPPCPTWWRLIFIYLIFFFIFVFLIFRCSLSALTLFSLVFYLYLPYFLFYLCLPYFPLYFILIYLHFSLIFVYLIFSVYF